MRSTCALLGVSTLGDLHGHPWTDLLAARNCGAVTIRELRALIQRAARGEFTVAPVPAGHEAARLVQEIDTSLAALPKPDRDLLLRRFGSKGRIHTLQALANLYGCHRERIRQREELHLEDLRRICGPGLSVALQQLRQRCVARICPLTPALFEVWLRQHPPARPPAWHLAFYLRLAVGLDPDFPAWPQGHHPYYAPRRTLRPDPRPILRKAGVPLSLQECLLRLRSVRASADLSVEKFLRTLRRAMGIQVDFAELEKPRVSLALPRQRPLAAPEMFRMVLSESSAPLQPEEILQRAREMFGPTAALPKHVTEALSYAPDIFYLGKDRGWGTRRHFILPAAEQARICNACVQLLEPRPWPLPVLTIAQMQLIPGVTEDNMWEVYAILLGNPRLRKNTRLSVRLKEDRPVGPKIPRWPVCHSTSRKDRLRRARRLAAEAGLEKRA